jgi:hypothetical protein
MSHLSDIEIVDLIDGTLRADRQRHVDGCDACRAQAEGLRSALLHASDADIPEPSPLFWDHFSARVHDAVHDASPEESGRWFSRPTLKWAIAGALATVVLVTALWQASAPSLRTAGTSGAPPLVAVSASDVDIDAFDPDTDQAWALVRAVADDSTWDDDDAEGGFAVRPGSAERAMADLTHAERSELVRLLEAEIRM